MAAPPPLPFIKRRGLVLYEDDNAVATTSTASASTNSSRSLLPGSDDSPPSTSTDRALAPTCTIPPMIYPFYFVSFNIPELTFIQDPWRLPTRWEQTDALRSVLHQGGRVARPYTLSIEDKIVHPDPARRCHVEWDPKSQKFCLNEQYMQVLDQALDVAREMGIRLILPLIDQWTWVGGVESMARWRGFVGKDCARAFWEEDVCLQDWGEVIRAVVGRRNTINGALYREDPTILAWETGNELDCPSAWTIRMARIIKEADECRHLVIDGHHGVDPGVLGEESIDIVSRHYYPSGDGSTADSPILSSITTCTLPPSSFVDALFSDLHACQGKKPFFVGEFGFASLSSTASFLSTLVAQAQAGQGVIGACLWSLRFRSFRGGFYFHEEPWGFNVFWAYHWPGFPSGDRYDERGMMSLLHTYGHLCFSHDSGIGQNSNSKPCVSLPSIPFSLPLPVPAPPRLLSVTAQGLLTFRGSTSARSYELHRCRDIENGGGRGERRGGGDWMVVERGVIDSWVPEQGQVLDKSLMRSPPSDFFYRLVAVNETGCSKPSGVLPLQLPRVGEGATLAPTVYYFIEETSQHVMLVGRRNVLPPSLLWGSEHGEGEGKGEGGEEGWLTRDLTKCMGFPRAAEGGRVCALGPEEEGWLVYGGWDGHLVEADIQSRRVVNHPLIIRGSPTVWRAPTSKASPDSLARAWVRDAEMDRLLMLSFDIVREKNTLKVEDVAFDGPELPRLGGDPVAVSAREVCYVGHDQRLYRIMFSFDESYSQEKEGRGGDKRVSFKYTLVDHSVRSGIHVRRGDELQILGCQKVIYVSAEGKGHIIEESRADGTSEEAWLVTDHTVLHGASPPVVGSVRVFPHPVVQVSFQSAADRHWYELWWAGESWRVSREVGGDEVVKPCR
ncbi:beta-mannanase [Nannochloropsis oceanica]